MDDVPEDPFFIVGRGRSGSTLLQMMLDAHPRISVPPESLFIMNTYKKYRHSKWDAATVRGFVRDVWREGRMKLWRVDKAQLEARLLDFSGEAKFANYCKLVYLQHALATQKPVNVRIGVKNPHYSLFVRTLIELFPKAPFIHLIRDYRDNILSYKKVPFDLKSTSALSYRWLRFNQEILRVSETAADRFLMVRFEDLVEQPDTVLKAICRHIDVSLEPEMLKFYESNDPSRHYWHANLSRPLDASALFKWHNEMIPRDIRLSEEICGPLGELFGYARSLDPAPRPSLSARIGTAIGGANVSLEKLLFELPMGIRSTVLTLYRMATRTL